MPQLLNTLASAEQVEETPSRRDGIPADFEDELRVYGCQLIQQAGILLSLPQVTMATAQVLFQRFWFVSSMRSFSIKDIGMGALFLSSKLEESPVRLRDLINVYDFLIRRGLHASKHNPCARARQLPRLAKEHSSPASMIPTPPFHYEPHSYFSTTFYDTKDALVIAEMQILKRLGFQVQVNLPYATMVNYLQLLGLTDAERHPGVAQRAWSILNDALQTPVYALFAPHVLAAASIYLVMHTQEKPVENAKRSMLPMQPKPWWELFDVTREELRIVCAHVLRLYDAEQGLAAAVRDEWGGLADFCERTAVREWIAAQSSASTTINDSTRK